MRRLILFSTASAIVLCAACAVAAADNSRSVRLPAGADILYNQNSDSAGAAVFSDNFTDGNHTTSGSQGADDFVVPKGSVWTITEVDVSGVYYNGSGPANFENVDFYRNKVCCEIPGKAVGRFRKLHGEDSAGSFAIALPKGGMTLRPGHYWVSIVANMDQANGGEWGWDVNSVLHNYPAVWRQRCNGCSICTNWETLEDCGLGNGPDLMFALRGTAKRE